MTFSWAGWWRTNNHQSTCSSLTWNHAWSRDRCWSWLLREYVKQGQLKVTFISQKAASHIFIQKHTVTNTNTPWINGAMNHVTLYLCGCIVNAGSCGPVFIAIIVHHGVVDAISESHWSKKQKMAHRVNMFQNLQDRKAMHQKLFACCVNSICVLIGLGQNNPWLGHVLECTHHSSLPPGSLPQQWSDHLDSPHILQPSHHLSYLPWNELSSQCQLHIASFSSVACASITSNILQFHRKHSPVLQIQGDRVVLKQKSRTSLRKKNLFLCWHRIHHCMYVACQATQIYLNEAREVGKGKEWQSWWILVKKHWTHSNHQFE